MVIIFEIELDENDIGPDNFTSITTIRNISKNICISLKY